MVATRLLDLVLLLSKEDSLVRQKYNFFVLPSDNWWSVFVFQRDASTMQVCWLTRGFLLIVQRFAISPTGQPMCIYGDPAYPLMVHLQAPFRQGRLTPQMQAYNDAMSEVRISVEWLFGDIINSFKFLDYKKNWRLNSAVWERCTWYVHCFEMPSLAFIKTKLHFFSNLTLRFRKNISSNF